LGGTGGRHRGILLSPALAALRAEGLRQAVDIHGQQQRVQQQHRADASHGGVRNERDVAGNRYATQCHHALHAEGREHEQ